MRPDSPPPPCTRLTTFYTRNSVLAVLLQYRNTEKCNANRWMKDTCWGLRPRLGVWSISQVSIKSWLYGWAGSLTNSQCCQLIFFFFTQYYCAEGVAPGLLGDGPRDPTPYSVSDGIQISARKGWGKQTPHNSRTDKVDQALCSGTPDAEGHCLSTSCRDPSPPLVLGLWCYHGGSVATVLTVSICTPCCFIHSSLHLWCWGWNPGSLYMLDRQTDRHSTIESLPRPLILWDSLSLKCPEWALCIPDWP